MSCVGSRLPVMRWCGTSRSSSSKPTRSRSRFHRPQTAYCGRSSSRNRTRSHRATGWAASMWPLIVPPPSQRHVPRSGPCLDRRPAPQARRRRAASAGLMSPAVRRLLAEHHVRPDDLTGSGAGGRITADDVLAHVAARSARRPGPGAPLRAAVRPAGRGRDPARPALGAPSPDRRAHGDEPAAHGSARDDGLRGGFRRRTCASRTTPRGLRVAWRAA